MNGNYFCNSYIKALPLRYEQLRNNLKIKPLSETSILCESSHFSHSDCGSSALKTYAKKAHLVRRKTAAYGGLLPAISGVPTVRFPE